MKTELSGLELRRAACEAAGLVQVDLISKVVWRSKYPFAPGYDHGRPGSYAEWGELPAIESTPAISEPMFLDWCAANEYAFTLKSYLQDDRGPNFTVEVFGRQFDIISAGGSTPSEARARAIVAASRAVKA